MGCGSAPLRCSGRSRIEGPAGQSSPYFSYFFQGNATTGTNYPSSAALMIFPRKVISDRGGRRRAEARSKRVICSMTRSAPERKAKLSIAKQFPHPLQRISHFVNA